MDFQNMTRLDVIYEALKQSTEQSQIASFTTRASRIELAIRDWELYHAERSYLSLDRTLNG